jgi:hypothetical protein
MLVPKLFVTLRRSLWHHFKAYSLCFRAIGSPSKCEEDCDASCVLVGGTWPDTVYMIECQPVLVERKRVILLLWGSDTVEMSVIRLVCGSEAVNTRVYARKRSPQPRRVFRVPSRTLQTPLTPSDFRISGNGLRIRFLHH